MKNITIGCVAYKFSMNLRNHSPKMRKKLVLIEQIVKIITFLSGLV